MTASELLNQPRRKFFGTLAAAFAAAQWTVGSAGAAQASHQANGGRAAAFGPLQSIDAGDLRVSYVEMGPKTGPAVILLHGWPYDIHSFVDVAPVLARKGHRVVVPYLRGYGLTRFLSESTPRNGQPAALAVDTIALMDALKIEKAVLAGFDWGARTADIIAVLWPERCTGVVSVSGYLIGSQEMGRQPLPPAAELSWWYQFGLRLGRCAVSAKQYSRSPRDVRCRDDTAGAN